MAEILKKICRGFKGASGFVKTHWKKILTGTCIFFLIGGGIQLYQIKLSLETLELSKKGIEHERSKIPDLKYNIQTVLSKRDTKIIQSSTDELVEKFYKKVFEYRNAHPDIKFKEAVKNVLPIEESIPLKPIRHLVTVWNRSENLAATANTVRIIIKTDRPISMEKCKSDEPNKIIEGGVGQNKITFEIDRVVSNDKVVLSIESEKVSEEEQLDRIKIFTPEKFLDLISYLKSGSGITQYSEAFITKGYSTYSPTSKATLPIAWKSIQRGDIILPGIPKIRYIPPKKPFIDVRVTFDRGEATLIEKQAENASEK